MPGTALVPALQEALHTAPNARRFMLYESATGEGEELTVPFPLAGEGQGGGNGVTVLAWRITDTCKEVIDGIVRRTVPRDTLVDAGGPWMFRRGELARALHAVGSGGDVSNLVDLCRIARLRVRVLIHQ
jgi:hypothetical protein